MDAFMGEIVRTVSPSLSDFRRLLGSKKNAIFIFLTTSSPHITAYL
jgi:hypothetical protein